MVAFKAFREDLPHKTCPSSHCLPFHIIRLQIDKGTGDPAGSVIQYWNLTVSDHI